jgi:hypothetical protein
VSKWTQKGTGTAIPTDKITPMIAFRLDEARKEAEDAERMRNDAVSKAEAWQREYERAEEQRSYWERVYEAITTYDENGDVDAHL